MPLTSELYKAVEKLDRNWSMGVELVSPLIYSLIRCTRPCSVLEIGAGYSTLFILQALADNLEEYTANKRVMEGQVRSDGHTGFRRLLRGRHPLPLALPEYYAADYNPSLSVIDDSSHPATSARLVNEAAEKLNLAHLLRFHDGQFQGMSKNLSKQLLPFDFVWFDCGGLTEFFDEYLGLINPLGGLIVIHSSLTNATKRAVLEELRKKQSVEQPQFEMLSLLEPHKWRQNSFTLLRRVSPELSKMYIPED